MRIKKGKACPYVVSLCFEKENDYGLKEGEHYLFNDGKKAVLTFCVGNKDYNRDMVRRAASVANTVAHKLKKKELLLDCPKGFNYKEVAPLFAQGLTLSRFSLDYKSKKEKKAVLNLILKEVTPAVKEAVAMAEAQNYSRQLANMPPNRGTPEFFAREAKKIAKTSNLRVRVLDKKALAKKGMNLALAVNSGSSNGVYLVHLIYKPAKAKKRVAIVGKGITFDSGGLGIKPGKSMLDMNLDKSGACDVLAVMRYIREVKPKVEVHGIAIFTENLPSGTAYKPSDVIESYSGKTVEVQHTDAEGRLILADALAYADKDVKADYIIDVATLTGAMLTTLGDKAIGLFTNSKKLSQILSRAGDDTFERVWELPMYKEYGEMVKSDIADIKNIGSWDGKAGSITAAKFLEEFVGKREWAHLDIASMMEAEWLPYIGKRGSGAGTRLLLESLKAF
ncbi:MAG: leucyl aminopeptidase family protein [Methanobacteriota archaeon]|nr:MAG: leucyl aminopeptidase family protein [Euryarchaeota archaeon]